jgi:hypothetical protein
MKERTLPELEDDDDKQAAALTERDHSIFLKVYDTEEDAVDTIFTDQTGRFPKKSSKGNQYIMVLCNIDSNSILVAAMKNRTSGEMIRAYQELIDRLLSAGIKPKRRILNTGVGTTYTPCNNLVSRYVEVDNYVT